MINRGMKIHKWYRTSSDSGELGLEDNRDGKLNEDSQMVHSSN